MPVKVEWGNEAQTLVVMHISEPYTPDEIVVGVEGINALMETVDHRVCPAADFSATRSLPRGSLASYRRIASKMGHPHSTGQLIVIGAHRYVRSLLDIFSKVFRKIEYAETLDEARVLVGEEQVPVSGE